MGKITQQMIEVSYEYGKKFARQEIGLEDAAEIVTTKSGMTMNSAKLALKNMERLLNEKIYFPTMSAKETIWKLEQIKKDYGLEKYLRVLKIVEQHLNTKKTPQNKIRAYIRNKIKKE